MSMQFDKFTNRRHHHSLKWDVSENELPMWVADMDFETAKEIQEAILEKARHGIYGYTIVPEAYYQSFQSWWKQRHQVTFETDWMIFCTGIVPAISSIVNHLTKIHDQVVVLSPTYNIFYNSIINHDRIICASELVYEHHQSHIDFEDLKQKLSMPETTLLLLCNPQNPIGKLWDAETLARIGELCNQYQVLVVADEIHADITAPGKQYTPFASVNQQCANNSITCVSASKAFNLAGLQAACVIIPNDTIRARVNRGLNTDEVAEPNVFAIEATIAAFQYGSEWLDALRDYLDSNKQIVQAYLREQLPLLTLVPSEATYLLWIDARQISTDDEALLSFVREQTGLWLSNGSSYGASGRGFFRMNIACPKERLIDGLHRLKQGITLYIDRT